MSEFWRRKLRTHFHRLDFDGDGKVNIQDFEHLADRCSRVTGSVDQAVRDKATALVRSVFKKFIMSTGNDDTGTELTAEVFVESIKQQKNDPAFRDAMESMIRTFLSAMVATEDGYLRCDDWHRFFAEFGFPDPIWAKLSFYCIDVDSDDKISFDQVVDGYFTFLFSEDPESPFTLYWGHLVQ